jgi:hypothetical protein
MLAVRVARKNAAVFICRLDSCRGVAKTRPLQDSSL